MELKRDFRIGDQVRGVDGGGWPSNPLGIVSTVPEATKTRQGEDYTYWVRFDPPALDGDGDGPYGSGQVLCRYLMLESNIRHDVANPGWEARTAAEIFRRLDEEAASGD